MIFICIGVTRYRDFATLIQSNFTVYILSLNHTIIGSTALIQGSRIGICSETLDILENASITSRGQGCGSLLGRGSLRVNSIECSAPGAGYGARGGHSTLLTTNSSRRIIISSHYETQLDSPMYPKYIKDDE
jgi:hypothetical protein